jgi:alpha-N-arabinofuranosidase
VFDGLYLSGVVLSEAELGPYVQDTLDELEYIMGDVSTPYGALRASHGYPKPWKIRFVEVGNEDSLDPNGLTTYFAYRFRAYQTAINAKYPDISVMTSYSNNTIGRDVPQAQSADYHQYSTPDAFVLTQYGFFDQNPVDSRTLIGMLHSSPEQCLTRLTFSQAS